MGGAFYSFGNMSTYMTSYMRKHSDSTITYTDFVVVQSAWGMTQGCVMPLSGFLINLIGEETSMVLGSIIFSGGCALTYFTIPLNIIYQVFLWETRLLKIVVNMCDAYKSIDWVQHF